MADRDDILAQYAPVTTADIIARMPYEGRDNVNDLKSYLRDRAMRGTLELSPEQHARLEREPKREANLPWLRRALDWANENVPAAMAAANFVGPKARLPAVAPAKSGEVWYHGSARDNPEFRDRPTYFARSAKDASSHAMADAEIEGGAPFVVPARLRFDNPTTLDTITMQDLHLPQHRDTVRRLREAGHDAVFPSYGDGEVAILDPSRIHRDWQLDASPEARLARAREQGYDMDSPFYRGVGQPYAGDEVTVSGGSGQALGPAVYMANKGTANSYAGDWLRYDNMSPAVYGPLYARGKMADVPTFMQAEELAAKLVPASLRGDEVAVMKKAQDILKEWGYVGVANGPKGNSTLAGVFDPTAVRHGNAMFDPAKINSRNLLAGIAPAAVTTAEILRAYYGDDQQ